MMAMNKTGIVIAVVLTCSLIAAASAIVVNQPLNQEPNPVATPSNTQTPISTLTPAVTTLLSTDFPATSTAQPTPTATPPIAPSSPVLSPVTTPTLYASPETIKIETAPVSNLFNAELDYVFVSGTNRTEQYHDHFGFGINGSYTYYPVEIVLNLTYRGNPENEPYGAKIEGYLINFTADTGAKASYVGFFGTNLNPAFDPASQTPHNLPFILVSAGCPSGFSLRLNLKANESFLAKQFSSSDNSGNPGLGVWSNGAPSTVVVTVQRVGWVIFDGGSAWFVKNPAVGIVLQQVQLEKVGDGFLHNRLPG
jgi:hypothetical protein